MLLVGLTGGIGSGKSVVARMLAARGAVILDADAFARDAVAAGTPGFEAVVRRFGTAVVGDDGELDRTRLAAAAFADDAARRDLEAIVHPIVRRRIAEAVREHAGTDRVVVLESPLLLEAGRADAVEVLVVVDAPEATRIRRLVSERGMTEEQVRARMAAQLPSEDKVRLADVVIDNDGTIDRLEQRVDRLWRDLRARAAPDA